MARRIPVLVVLLVGVAVVAMLVIEGRGGRREVGRRERAPVETPDPVLLGASRPDTAEVATQAPGPVGAAVEEVIEAYSEVVGEEEAPPDPPQRGNCALRLSFERERDGEPVAVDVQLWRLDAPGNADWERGDQLQVRTTVPREGTTLHDLPADRYRLHLPGLRRGAQDPAAFEVLDAAAVQHFAVPMPRDFDVTLRVVDEHGIPLTRLTFAVRHDQTVNEGTVPAWRRSRRVRRDDVVVVETDLDFSESASDVVIEQRQAQDGMFHLARVPEPSRSGETVLRMAFPMQTTDVSVAHVGEARDVAYLAVTLPMDEIRASVRMPNGDLAVEAGARLTASCRAVDLTGRSDDFRAIPVEVRVRLDGYEPLDFQVRAGEVPPMRTLLPVRPAADDRGDG